MATTQGGFGRPLKPRVQLPQRRLKRSQVERIVQNTKRSEERAIIALRKWEKAKQINSLHTEQVAKARAECQQYYQARWMQPRNISRYMVLKDEYDRKRELLEWFRFMDVDGSGEISFSELEDPLLSMGFATSSEEVANLIAKVDEDGSGEIGFEEFYTLVSSADGEEVNPIVALYEALKDGQLGDQSLQLPSLILTYRRHVMLKGLVAHTEQGRPDTAASERARVQASVNALENVIIAKQQGRDFVEPEEGLNEFSGVAMAGSTADWQASDGPRQALRRSTKEVMGGIWKSQKRVSAIRATQS